jgi:hypothetical protein
MLNKTQITTVSVKHSFFRNISLTVFKMSYFLKIVQRTQWSKSNAQKHTIVSKSIQKRIKQPESVQKQAKVRNNN